MAIPEDNMEYRRLGATGLKVSVLSYGSWVTFDTQMADDPALECMQAAHDAGCNFFDNAEAYAGGRSESIMGRVFRDLGGPAGHTLPRQSCFGVSTETTQTCATPSTASI